MDTFEQKKRLPAVPSKASALPESGRVSVIGTLVDFDDDSLVIDDGTGSVTGRLSDETIKNCVLDKGGIFRLIGRMSGNEVTAEIIQDFNGFDSKLYEKALEMFRKEVKV
ncbi:MAG: hypothetical protein HZB68_04100 [Candidatus Aenigmarchaeota archaeon]|nr:hypothetical protein [Candidatus Aenigmarchaeota archaeon]